MDPRDYQQPQRSSATPQRRPTSGTPANRQREATLSMIRSEISSLFGGTPHAEQTSQPAQRQQQPTATLPPKAATHAAAPAQQQHTDSNAEHWRKYHSAWQEYYRKYYEQYYMTEVQKNIASQRGTNLAQTAAQPQQHATQTAPATAAKPAQDAPISRGEGLITQNEALTELRENIIKNAQDSVTKVRKSRHFIPIFSAILVVATVALLQYNQVLVAHVKAYMTPGNIEPQNIIVNPSANVPVGPETKMIIPKINVDAPIVMNVGPTNEEQLKAMEDGIAHVRYPGASAEPGEVGNSVFSAHSSSDWTDTGAYKFIFVQLERLAIDDVIYINYNSQRYSYKVTQREVVDPTNIGALRYDGDKPVITLITCVPLGTADNRLLITAEQVSPDPTGAAKPDPAAEPPVAEAAPAMTGTAPTLIERLFGQ